MAVDIDNSDWSIEKSAFREIMTWAKEPGHTIVLIHLLQEVNVVIRVSWPITRLLKIARFGSLQYNSISIVCQIENPIRSSSNW